MLLKESQGVLTRSDFNGSPEAFFDFQGAVVILTDHFCYTKLNPDPERTDVNICFLEYSSLLLASLGFNLQTVFNYFLLPFDIHESPSLEVGTKISRTVVDFKCSYIEV